MRVPVLATEKDTALHRRDPRAKWLVFFVFIAFMFAAPSWPWMVAAAGVGLLLAWTGRTPAKWLAVLWALQIPNFLALIVVPLLVDYFGDGTLQLGGSTEFSLKLGFAWSAALFVSIALFSTMQVDEMVDGLHGLRFPYVAGFTLGYMFLLMYTSVSDILRIADAMKVKGVNLETRNPGKLVAAVPRLMIPAMFTMVRRANTMMAVLEMRGFSASRRGARRVRMSFGAADAAMVAAALGCLGLAFLTRYNVLPAVV